MLILGKIEKTLMDKKRNSKRLKSHNKNHFYRKSITNINHLNIPYLPFPFEFTEVYSRFTTGRLRILKSSLQKTLFHLIIIDLYLVFIKFFQQ